MSTAIRLVAMGIAMGLGLPVAHAAEPAYPERPIRLIISTPAGAGPDIVGRVLAERLWKAWGQRVVVDNRPGAVGTISAELTKRAAPDGYTWLILTSSLLVASEVYQNLKFDLHRDFASIAFIGTVPMVLMVNPQVPAKSVSELIELAKKTPGSLRYGSPGTGGGEHLAKVMFTHMSGTNILHVPYKGIPQAIADTIAREVHLTFAVLPVALPSLQAGRLRALGVTTRNRAALLPDVPSISITVPGYETFGWYSAVAPTGVPPGILDKASAEVVKAVKEPAFGEQLKELGIDIVGGSRAELDTFRRGETKRIRDLVKATGLTLTFN